MKGFFRIAHARCALVARFVAMTFVVALPLIALPVVPAQAQTPPTSTWLGTASGNLADPANWSTVFPSGNEYPSNGSVTFGASSNTNLVWSSINPNLTFFGWTFSAGAPAYTYTNDVGNNLILRGAGIVNNSSQTVVITNNPGGTLTFGPDSIGGTQPSLGNNVVYYNAGDLSANNAMGGNAVIYNTDAGSTLSFGGGNLQNATIHIDQGSLLFSGTTDLGNAVIDNKTVTNIFGVVDGDHATITNEIGAVINVRGGTLGNATITNKSGAVINFLPLSTTPFSSGTGTGGNAVITNQVFALIDFSGTAGPQGDNKVSVGAILDGSGGIYLGANTLTVGGTNQDMTWSGLVSDCGATGNDCLVPGATGGGLDKVGTGKLTLLNTSYTGITAVDGGTLQLGDATHTATISGNVRVASGAFLDSVNTAFLNLHQVDNAGMIQFHGRGTFTGTTFNNAAGGVIDFSDSTGTAGDGKISVGALTGAGNFYLGSRTIITGNFNTTVSGVISDCGASGTDCAVPGATGGALVQSGPGVMTLTGHNTYTGGTTVSNGELHLGDATHAGSIVGTVTVSGGGHFRFVNADTSGITNITNSAFTYFLNDTTASMAAINNSQGLVFQDSSSADHASITNTNEVTFRNTATAGDASIANTGHIFFSDNSTGGNAAIDNTAASGVVDFSLSSGPNGDHKLSAGSIAGTGSFILGANQLTVGANNLSTEVSGIISGAGGSLVKTGMGTLILSGNDTYSGATTIANGILQIGNGGTSGSIAGNVVDNSVLVFDRSDAVTIAGAISGSGVVQQIGLGTTILTGSNSYGGDTTVSAGRLQFGDGSSGGGSNNLGGNINVTGGSLAVEMPATLNVAHNVIFGDNTMLSIVASPGGPSLTADSVTIGNGVAFNIGGVTSASQVDKVLIDTRSGIGGDFDMVSVGGSTGPVDYLTLSARKSADDLQYLVSYGLTWMAGPSLGNGTFTLTNATDNFMVGVGLSDQTGPFTSGWNGTSLTKAGLGTLILSGDNIYTGGTIITGGTLQLGNGGTTGSILGDVVNGGVLAFDRSDTYTFSGAILGGGAVQQIGSGTTILTGLNTYSGGTSFLNGELSVSGDAALGAVTGGLIFNGGTLQVTGTAFTSTARTITWGANGGGFDIADPSNAFTVGQVLSGGGPLAKFGPGTLILTGANTYAGGTSLFGGTLSVSSDLNLGAATGGLSFDGGTLQVTGTAFTSTARTISWGANGGGFDIADPSNTFTVSQALIGGGPLVKSGAGTLILSGDNAYTGGTTIANGTLQIGDGGTSGSIAGDVIDKSVLVFNRSDALTLAGAISGTGAVRQIGIGTTILTGTDTYTGGTTISGGTLQIGDGGTSGSIVGDVTDNGALAFNRSDAITFAGAISGNGMLRQIGAGKTVLTGDSSGFAGVTSVENGTLAVNGTLGGSIDVLAAGRLQGNGTVGNTSVSGSIAPGNSIGTINIAGNITFNPGSTYEVEVDAAGQSDKIAATGAIIINGGTVRVLAGTGSYTSGVQYSILSAAGGISGMFDASGVSSNFAFLDSSLSYDATSVNLALTRNSVAFADVGITPNQIATGGGAESLGSGNPVYNAILGLSTEQARHAFDQLSGEIYASVKTALIEDSRFIRNAVSDRIRTAFDGVGASGSTVVAYGDGKPRPAAATTDHLAVWAQAFGSWGHTDGNSNAARLNRSTGGFFVGLDAPIFDTWRVGAVTGYSRTGFDADDRYSSGSSDNYHVGVYGGTQWGALGFRTGAAYTWHDISTTRNVSFPGFGDHLKADYDAGTAQVFSEFGYGIRAGRFGFEPFANLAYVNLQTYGFTENGGPAALTGASASTDATFTTLGARASTDFILGGMGVAVKGMIGWRHAYGDATPLSVMRFAGGDAFGIAGVPIARDAAVTEAGFDFALAPAAALGLSYGGQFGSGFSDQSVKARFNVQF